MWYMILIICLIYYLIVNANPYFIIDLWNKYLTSLRDKQNVSDCIDPINVPGLQFARKSLHPSIRKLNELICTNHDTILNEVNKLLSTGYTGLPMWQIDSTQEVFKSKADGWRPIWVKFFDQYAGTANHLPTLKSIVDEIGPDLILLHISMFLPRTILAPHYGICKGHYRFHYGLKIPQGDIGLKIHNGLYRWKDREGIQFDDTYLHSSWNKSDSVRLVIFADVKRQMNFVTSFINDVVYWLLQKTKHIKSVKDQIKRQEIVLD